VNSGGFWDSWGVLRMPLSAWLPLSNPNGS